MKASVSRTTDRNEEMGSSQLSLEDQLALFDNEEYPNLVAQGKNVSFIESMRNKIVLKMIAERRALEFRQKQQLRKDLEEQEQRKQFLEREASLAKMQELVSLNMVHIDEESKSRKIQEDALYPSPQSGVGEAFILSQMKCQLEEEQKKQVLKCFEKNENKKQESLWQIMEKEEEKNENNVFFPSQRSNLPGGGRDNVSGVNNAAIQRVKELDFIQHKTLILEADMMLGEDFVNQGCSLNPLKDFFVETSKHMFFTGEQTIKLNKIDQGPIFPKGYSFSKIMVVKTEWVMFVSESQEFTYVIEAEGQKEEVTAVFHPESGTLREMEMKDWQSLKFHPSCGKTENPVYLTLIPKTNAPYHLRLKQVILATEGNYSEYVKEVKITLNLPEDIESVIAPLLSLEAQRVLACTSLQNYQWVRQQYQREIGIPLSQYPHYSDSVLFLLISQLKMVLQEENLCPCVTGQQDYFNIETEKWEEKEDCHYCLDKRKLTNRKIMERLQMMIECARSERDSIWHEPAKGTTSYFAHKAHRRNFPHELTWFALEAYKDLKEGRSFSPLFLSIGNVMEDVMNLWNESKMDISQRQNWTYDVWEGKYGGLTVEEPGDQIGFNYHGQVRMLNGPWLPRGAQYKIGDPRNWFKTLQELLDNHAMGLLYEDKRIYW